MQDFFFAANPSVQFTPMLLPADIESALHLGRLFVKQGKLAESESAYWQGFDQAVLDDTSHHLRTMLGEGQGVIGQAQTLTTQLLLELGYFYEDLGEYEHAACCYGKAKSKDAYMWQRHDAMVDKHDAHYSEEAWGRLMERVSHLTPTTQLAEPAIEPRKAPLSTAVEPPIYNAA